MDKKRHANGNHYFDKMLETMPAGELKAFQFDKTKEILERVHAGSMFYRERFDNKKVKPEDFKKLEDIARFPFINKQDLVKDQEENPPFGRRVCLPPDEIRRINVTSGSSGMGQELHCHEENSLHAANASTAVHFATPSGKIELSSKVLEALGYDPLPQYHESPESPVSRPDLAGDYPLILITGGRHLPYYHSEHRQVPSMRKMHPDPIMQIHPDTAARFGIQDGNWVWIESPRGRIQQKCRLFEGIDPRVVHAQHGWWYPEEDGAEPSLHGVWKSNCNVLTDDDPDRCNPISGGWPLRTLLCKVYPV